MLYPKVGDEVMIKRGSLFARESGVLEYATGYANDKFVVESVSYLNGKIAGKASDKQYKIALVGSMSKITVTGYAIAKVEDSKKRKLEEKITKVEAELASLRREAEAL